MGQSLAADVTVEDRIKMIEAATAIAAGADRHEWDRVRAAFAPEVTLDYSSLWGGEAQTLAAEAIIAQWSSFLPGFDQTHHMVTNHSVVSSLWNKAQMNADFQATHRIEDQTWTLLGRYTYTLQKQGEDWVVSALTMEWTHEHGDRALVGLAAERAQP